MARMIDQIRENKVPSNMMQFAARGALSVPPAENLEILVYLARHSKVFGDLAKMTLAGWDLQACREAAVHPYTTREVLEYLISPDNLRPQLFPALLENKIISAEVLVKIAVSATREQIEAMLKSARVRASVAILEALKPNPYLKPTETAEITGLLSGLRGETIAAATVANGETPDATSAAENSGDVFSVEEEKTVAAYLETNAAEIAAEGSKPFQAIGGVYEEADPAPAPAVAPAFVASSSGAAAAPALAPAAPKEEKRLNTVQKIAKLDVKGRIQAALKGNKEERSLLIRDGTKVVALAVLDAPKLSDGEVEKFASQKNVLVAVLRQIVLKRRFAKNYIVIRNLVGNPRTPIDLSLGLMKNLLIQDLKNISNNKEIPETIRKLALRQYKQKTEDKKK